MNWVDLFVIAVVAISALLGLSRGLVREVLGLGAWILAGYGAYVLGPTALPLTQRLIGNGDIARPVAYAVTFVLLLIILSLLSNLVGRVVSGSALGGLDRSLGLLFGVLRGAVILMIAYIPLALVLPVEKWPPALHDARTLPWIHDGAVWLANDIPQTYRPRVADLPGTSPSMSDLLHVTPEGRALGPPDPHP